MGILLWIVFGILAGSVARLVMPGPSAGGVGVAVSLGVAGAVAGGFVGTLLGGSLAEFDFRSLLLAIIGSLGVLFSYRSYAMRAMA
jgi:uncharacterized membrane protein YeaQ/YmgE (transglycosylase-associated protein family)